MFKTSKIINVDIWSYLLKSHKHTWVTHIMNHSNNSGYLGRK